MSGGCDREETAEEQAWREGAAHERARILGPHATAADASELATALQAYHQGTERGELRRLLVRLRGPSPSLHEQTTAHLKAINDMERGLAARESQAAPRYEQAKGQIREADEIFTRLETEVTAIIQRGASELRAAERSLRPVDLAPGDEEDSIVAWKDRLAAGPARECSEPDRMHGASDNFPGSDF